MIEKVEEVGRRFDRLSADLSNPQVLADAAKLKKVTRERSALERLVDTFRSYKKVIADLRDVEQLLAGPDAPEFKALAREELPGLKESRDQLEEKLTLLLIPKDPNDGKDGILEIRAVAGGERAGPVRSEVRQIRI